MVGVDTRNCRDMSQKQDRDFLTQYCSSGLYPMLQTEKVTGHTATVALLTNTGDSHSIELPYGKIRYNSDFPDRVYDMPNEEMRQDEVNKDTILAMNQAMCSMGRELNRQMWNGINYGSAGRSMWGLDAQIRGEANDMNVKSPALMGSIIDFEGKSIMGNIDDSGNILSRITSMRRYLYDVAHKSYMLPATWIVAMRPETWYELAPAISSMTDFVPRRNIAKAFWECLYCGSDRSVNITQCFGNCGGSKEPSSDQYICLYCGRVYHDDKAICWDMESGTGCGAIEATMRIENTDGLQKIINGDESLYHWMMNECKMPIDGHLYDVVLDRYIQIDRDRNTTSIYFIPMTIYGDILATYLSRPTYDNIPELYEGKIFMTDNGKVTWNIATDMWDTVLEARTDECVVMRAPQLGGVIENIELLPI